MTDDFLYNDGRIRINYFGKSVDEHNLFIDSKSFFLGRGVLKDLALTPSPNLCSKLYDVNDLIDSAVVGGDLSYGRVGLALAQARIRELQEGRDVVGRHVSHILPKVIPVPPSAR